jgi:hypothetical protein
MNEKAGQTKTWKEGKVAGTFADDAIRKSSQETYVLSNRQENVIQERQEEDG